jgi:hypothetical protein
MARRSIWERLHESTEGPTVTISLPREWAEELMRSLMTSLEIDDGAGDPDMDDSGLDDMDPTSDMDAGFDDSDDEPGFSAGDEGDDVPDFAAGDDEDEEDDDDDAPPPPPAKKKSPAKGKEKSKEKDDDSDDDDKDEATDYGQVRPGTALGESAFSRLAGKLARSKVKASVGRRR